MSDHQSDWEFSDEGEEEIPQPITEAIVSSEPSHPGRDQMETPALDTKKSALQELVEESEKRGPPRGGRFSRGRDRGERGYRGDRDRDRGYRGDRGSGFRGDRERREPTSYTSRILVIPRGTNPC